MTATSPGKRDRPPAPAPTPELSAPSPAAMGAAAALALALLPFFALTAFVHPQNDDWVFAAGALTDGYAGANAFWYQAWTGRYAATAVLTGSPIALGVPGAFGVLVAANLALFVAGAIAAALAILPRALGTARRVGLGVLFAALHVALMPSTSEGVYWLAGTVTYLTPSALILLLVGVLGLLERATGWWTGALALAAAVLAAGAAGGNEVSLLAVDLLAGGWFAWRSWRERRLRWDLGAIAAVAAAGSLVAFLAPGNHVRLESTGGVDLARGIGVAARAWGRFLLHALAGPLVPALALAAPSLAGAARAARWQLPHPALAGVAALGATFAACLVPAVGAGVVEQRALNVVHWVFLAGAFLVAASTAAWVERRAGRPLAWPRAAAAAVAVAALALAAAFPSAVRLAWTDLVSGDAARWDAAIQDRERLVRECRQLVCEVPRPPPPPRSMVWFEDAVDEQGDTPWFQNYKSAYAACFGKARIRLGPVR